MRRPSPALVVACIALLVALTGTSYATVLNVPKNSVGTAELKRNAVKPAKLAPNAVRSGHVLDGTLLVGDFKPGQIPQGPKGDKGDKGDKGTAGATNVVVRMSAITTSVAGTSSSNRTANCNAGERAVGGGAGLTGGGSTSALTVRDGKPVPLTAGATPTGWNAGVTTTISGLSWAVYVICASP